MMKTFLSILALSAASARLSGDSSPPQASELSGQVKALPLQNRELLQLPGTNRSACDLIHQEDLPEECSCTEPDPFGLVIQCLKPFESLFFNDTIGMRINLDPCNPSGSSLSLDVTEEEHNIDITIVDVRAGEEQNFPIPGVSIAIPKIGHMGVDIAVLIYGNPDKLSVKVGLNACMAAGQHHQFCASEVPGLSRILPWYALKGTYEFGSFCNNTNTSTSLPPSPPIPSLLLKDDRKKRDTLATE